MMELVDMRDLGSRAVMRWGSSPHARTIGAVWSFQQRFLLQILTQTAAGGMPAAVVFLFYSAEKAKAVS